MKVMKKAIEVRFQFASQELNVETLEGVVTARPGDAIITGPKGEQYPIQRHKFEETYNFNEALGTCSKKPIVVEAQEMSEPFTVKVGWSDQPLQGKAGDYRLTYGPGDFGVVEREIFAQTYEILEA